MSAARTGAWSAWRRGVGMVGRAPAVLLLVWLTSLAFAAPLALGVRRDVARQIGPSLEAARRSVGATHDWLSEFGDQASGVSTTLAAPVLGFAAVVDNLSGFLDRDARPIAITAIGVVYGFVWTVLAGGVIDRYARDRATRAAGFFGAVGGFGGRLLRLSAIAALLYGGLFGGVHGWLGGLFERLTADLDSERTAFAGQVAVYAVFLLAVAGVNVWFDYAKVRLIVEDRRSVCFALIAAARFIRRRAPGVLAVYALDAGLVGAVLAAYAPVAAATAGGINPWPALVAGQLYVVARLWVKLVFWASATAFFQGRLARPADPAAPLAG